MKAMKKIAAFLLTACLAVPAYSMVVSAAEGTLMISDPETKVGETVEVNLVVQTGGDAIGDADVTMSYDTSALEFVSGEGVESDGAGTLTFSDTGDGTESELRTTMQFRALKAGDTSITVDESTAYLYSDETLNLEEGSSAISIAAADDGSTTAEASGDATAATTGSTTDIVVSVNGTDYNFSDAFTTTDIPAGYSETTMTFNGGEHKFVENEAGVTLGYLVDGTGAGRFFLFNDEDATFSPYAEISVSDTTSIILLSGTEGVNLPESYQQVEMTVLDQNFPAWSDPADDRYYIVNALNTRTGAEGLYQYDTEDGTYQSFTAPAVEEETGSDGILGTIGSFMGDHTLIVLIAGVLVVLILLILMIVFAVKLVHRNQELDDLYDEYDIPFDDEEEDKPAVQKKSRKQFVGHDDDDDDGFGDYDDDGDYDDEDDYDDDNDSYDDDDYDDDDSYDEYDDEYEDDYEEDTRKGDTRNIKKSRKGRKSSGNDDDYEIDFIDL